MYPWEVKRMKFSFKMSKKEFIKKLFLIILGDSLAAFALVFFFKPNQMISAGVDGLSVMIEYVTGIPLGLLILLFNIPLIILSLKFLDIEFSIFTMISVFALSTSITFFEYIKPIGFAFTNEIFLACVYGGIIKGIGAGIVFKSNACSGGFDIIAAIMKKYFNIAIGNMLLLINLFIVSISAFVYSPDKAMYTLIALSISFKVVDIVQLSAGKQKQIFIISEKSKEITSQIQSIVSRGVTYLDGTGAYKEKDVKVIYLICSARELVRVKNIVKQEDKNAFIAVSDTSEIEGRGFKRIAI